MASVTKDASVSVRITTSDKVALEAMAVLCSSSSGTLAAAYIAEGLRRSRFPAVDFRDGFPGRIAYLAGTRWPVWMIADLANELEHDLEAVAKRVRRPAALIGMALRYAETFPDEIAAAQQLAQGRAAA